METFSSWLNANIVVCLLHPDDVASLRCFQEIVLSTTFPLEFKCLWEFEFQINLYDNQISVVCLKVSAIS